MKNSEVEERNSNTRTGVNKTDNRRQRISINLQADFKNISKNG